MKIKFFVLVCIVFLVSQTGYAKAFDDFRAAAQRGDAEAQLAVALRCFSGLGTEIDKDEGYYWLSQAANNGNTEAFRELFRRANTGDSLAKKYYDRIYKDANELAAKQKTALRKKKADEELMAKQRIISPKQETHEDNNPEQSALERIESIFNYSIEEKQQSDKKRNMELVIKNGFGAPATVKRAVKLHTSSNGQLISLEQTFDSSLSFFNPSITVYNAVDPDFKVGLGATLGILEDKEDNKYDFDAIYLSAKVKLNMIGAAQKTEVYLLGEIGFSRLYANLSSVNKEFQSRYGYTLSEKSKFSDIYYGFGVGFCVDSQIIVEFLYQHYSGGQNVRIENGSSRLDGMTEISYKRIAVTVGLKFDL